MKYSQKEIVDALKVRRFDFSSALACRTDDCGGRQWITKKQNHALGATRIKEKK